MDCKLEWLAGSELRNQVVNQRLVLLCGQFRWQSDDLLAIHRTILALKLLRCLPQYLRVLVRPCRQVAMPRRDQILMFLVESLPRDIIRVVVCAASALDLDMKAGHWCTTLSAIGKRKADEVALIGLQQWIPRRYMLRKQKR